MSRHNRGWQAHCECVQCRTERIVNRVIGAFLVLVVLYFTIHVAAAHIAGRI